MLQPKQQLWLPILEIQMLTQMWLHSQLIITWIPLLVMLSFIWKTNKTAMLRTKMQIIMHGLATLIMNKTQLIKVLTISFIQSMLNLRQSSHHQMRQIKEQTTMSTLRIQIQLQVLETKMLTHNLHLLKYSNLLQIKQIKLLMIKCTPKIQIQLQV